MTRVYRYRDNSGLVRWVVRLLYLYAVICVISVVSGWMEYDLLRRLEAGSYFSEEIFMRDAEANDQRQRLVAIAGLVALLAAAISSLTWIYRANVNARAMGADLEISPGWAVGWFFIPIASLFKPFEAMSDLWKGSTNPARWREQSQPEWLLRGWWGLFLVSNILSVVALRLSQRAEEIPQFMNVSLAFLASDVLDIGAALLYATIIRRIHAMQHPPEPAPA